MTLFNRILPPSIDNTFRGHRLALWLFGLVALVKTGIALGTIFNGRAAAQSADGIPLDSFGVSGAAAFLTIFALWGLSQLAISAFSVLALTRYRAMIPLMFVVLLVEHTVRRGMVLAHPIATSATPPGLSINLTLLVVMAVGLVLSVRPVSARG